MIRLGWCAKLAVILLLVTLAWVIVVALGFLFLIWIAPPRIVPPDQFLGQAIVQRARARTAAQVVMESIEPPGWSRLRSRYQMHIAKITGPYPDGASYFGVPSVVQHR